MSCDSCIHGHPDGEKLICRRYPPTIVVRYEHIDFDSSGGKVFGNVPNYEHPVVLPHDICGEHE